MNPSVIELMRYQRLPTSASKADRFILAEIKAYGDAGAPVVFFPGVTVERLAEIGFIVRCVTDAGLWRYRLTPAAEAVLLDRPWWHIF